MKSLTKILGVSLLGMLSLNLNAQHKSFVKEDYDKYFLTYALADINDDSIPDVVVVDYDLNRNGKKDIRGFFIITGKGELTDTCITYYTKNNACMLVLDRDEDGVDDEILADSDLDDELDFYRNLKDIRKPKALIL